MKKKEEKVTSDILPVNRSKEEAKRFYDRISGVYDFTGVFERKYSRMAIELLSIKEGETVLEIGFGTGHSLSRLAKSVGKTGRVYGIDISSGMLEVTSERLYNSELLDKVKLHYGDAVNLPYSDGIFDVAFISFTLELFDTNEIPRVLEEVRRVLKPWGRVGVVSISKENGRSLLLRLYEWAHKQWPKYVDCRPIYLEQSLRDSEYEIITKHKVKLFGLPVEIVVAAKERHRGHQK